MQDKNFIAFLVMSILLIFLWMTFFAPKPKQPPAGGMDGDTVAAAPGATTTAPPPAPTMPPATGAQPAVPNVPAPASGTTTAAVPAPPATPAPAAIAAAPSRFTVKTDLYEIEFDPAGAAPVHWRLLKYSREKCFPAIVQLAWPPLVKNPPCDPSPVDLVDPRLPENSKLFLSQNVIDGQTITPAAVWKAENTTLDFQSGNTAEVVFSTPLRDGRSLKKIFRLNRSSYLSELVFKVEGGAPTSAATDLGLLYHHNPQGRKGAPNWNFMGALYVEFRNEERTKFRMAHIEPAKAVKAGLTTVEQANWAGFTDEYFLQAALAPDKGVFGFAVQFLGTEEERKDKKRQADLAGWMQERPDADELKAGIAGRFLLFMGPKDKKVLTPIRETLKYSIDYGRLGLLVEPLIWLVVSTEELVGNYGVAILIVTVILRMLMFPLTRKSQKSMKEIQKLQPEIAKIKEKYPDDRVKQQEETQELWRRHKINPAMGCLPILLQFPVFMAFYKALLISIELRQAPFFAWIQDLSARDPYYIWPVLMGATQVVTQKLTPTQMDPTQAKIFLIMPIVFMFILKDFPSGLLVYWTVQNIVGIGQQIYVNRTTD